MRHFQATINLNIGDSFHLSHLPTLCGKRQEVSIYTLTASRRPSISPLLRHKSGLLKYYSPAYPSVSQEVQGKVA
jgi:hypothetical protein